MMASPLASIKRRHRKAVLQGPEEELTKLFPQGKITSCLGSILEGWMMDTSPPRTGRIQRGRKGTRGDRAKAGTRYIWRPDSKSVWLQGSSMGNCKDMGHCGLCAEYERLQAMKRAKLSRRRAESEGE